MATFPYIDRDKKTIESSHIVILGAGASKAAFPEGDASHMKLPLMSELIEMLDLEEAIRDFGYTSPITDFEEFYSEIYENQKYRKLVEEINDRVVSYFSKLTIPQTVTLYDYLVLSLRQKDIIGTFNWDPLLLQAYRRNIKVGDLPKPAFLHGNVYLGVCKTHNKFGYLGTVCQACNHKLEPTRLLYPTTKKDYEKDSSIKNQWEILTDHINIGYFLTIFGYSAPKTDEEARKLMHRAWSTNKTVDLAQIEVIDIKDREQLEETWKEFTVRQHYGIFRNFNESWLWSFPRQTCEALFDATMQNDPRRDNPFPNTDNLSVLQDFIINLRIEELHI